MSLPAFVDTATTESVVAVSPPVAENTEPVQSSQVNPKVEAEGLSDFEIIDGGQDNSTSHSDRDSEDNTSDSGDASDGSDDSDSSDDTVGIVGELYDTPPSSMVMDPSIISETYYAVYVGRRVGITTESSIALALMNKLPGGSQKSFKTQEGAVAAFNRTLAVPGAVRVAFQ